MKKRHLYLVSTVAMKKKYTTFTIVMCDESIFEFSLNEWRICKEEEWVEVEKLDKTEMHIFSTQNIMRVKFTCVEKKSTGMTDITPFKPVSPTVA